MTRAEYIRKITEALSPRYGGREASSMAWLIAEALAGFDRRDLAADPQAGVRTERMEEVVGQVAGGRPVQYALGRAWFRGLEFEVDGNVLIPRPETEELVEWILSSHDGPAEILDIGTGSGAIAVSLAREMPAARVTASDISQGALSVAARNAAWAGVAVDFILADILAGEPSGIFDVIVSNPPYIPADEISRMAAHVTAHEPHTALFVPQADPLLFYRAIARHASTGGLSHGGSLYLEVHEDFAGDVCDLLAREGLMQAEMRRDMNGKPRMVRCKKT